MRVCTDRGSALEFLSLVQAPHVAAPHVGLGWWWCRGSGVAAISGSSVLCLFNSLWLKCQFSARLAWLLQNRFC